MPLWCVAPLEMNEGNSLGARVQSAYRLQRRKSPTRDFNFFYAVRKLISSTITMKISICKAVLLDGLCGCEI